MIRLLNGLNMGGQLIPAETVLVLPPEMEEKLIVGGSAERVATQAYVVEEQATVNEKPPEDVQTHEEDADIPPIEEPGAETPKTDEVIPEDARTPEEDADTPPVEEPGAETLKTDEVIPEEKPVKKQK